MAQELHERSSSVTDDELRMYGIEPNHNGKKHRYKKTSAVLSFSPDKYKVNLAALNDNQKKVNYQGVEDPDYVETLIQESQTSLSIILKRIALYENRGEREEELAQGLPDKTADLPSLHELQIFASLYQYDIVKLQMRLRELYYLDISSVPQLLEEYERLEKEKKLLETGMTTYLSMPQNETSQSREQMKDDKDEERPKIAKDRLTFEEIAQLIRRENAEVLQRKMDIIRDRIEELDQSLSTE